jgi:hypothetical protein
MEHRIPGARDRRLSQQDPGYAASGERHDESAEIRSSTPRPTDQPLELNGWLSRSAPTSLVKSWLRAAPGTKINSSNPPLTAVGTPYPAEPLLRLLHPIVQPTSVRPCGHIHLDRRINCTAISVAVLARIELHMLEHVDDSGGREPRPAAVFLDDRPSDLLMNTQVPVPLTRCVSEPFQGPSPCRVFLRHQPGQG